MGDDEAAAAQPSPVFDTTVSYSARIWNYWLGGKDNYAADREAGDKVALMLPSIVPQARADRAFLGRAIRYLAGEAGHHQVLYLGTRVPARGNTHEGAHQGEAKNRDVERDNDSPRLAATPAQPTTTTPIP